MKAMDEGFRLWANPSSPHAEGRKARSLLEGARERIKAMLGWDGELIFTSGASEAAALALHHAKVRDFAMSTVEHTAMLWFENDSDDAVEVGIDGGVLANSLEECVWAEHKKTKTGRAAECNRRLIGVQHLNSETGNRQDISAMAEIVHNGLGYLITDCSQSAAKFALPKEADFAIFAAHKFGGPIGVGALLVKDFAMLAPTGGQERGYRPGTENLPGVLGMAEALDASGYPYLAADVLEPFDGLAEECRKLGGTWLSDRLSDPTPYIRAIAMPNMSATAQVMRFDMAGISVSQGSACSSGTMKTSRVLQAMQVEPEIAANTIRVSVGWNTTRADVERFCEVWLDLARR